MPLPPLRKYGESRLSQPIGIEEERARQAHDRSVKNEVQEMKRSERLGRRAYRAALRGRDPSAYIKGLEALEMTRDINGTSGAGIKMAGTLEPAIEGRIDRTREQIDSFGNKTMDEQGNLLRRGQSRLNPGGMARGDGSGSSAENSSAQYSKPGQWVNVGGAPQQEATSAAAPPAQEASSRPSRLSALVDTRQQFAQDLSVSKLIEDQDEGAIARAIERGSRLGLFPEKVRNYAGLPEPPAQEPSASSAAAARYDSLVEKYKGQFPGLEHTLALSDDDKLTAERAGKINAFQYPLGTTIESLTPAHKRQLRRVVGLFKGHPGDEEKIRGEIAIGDLVSRVASITQDDAKNVASKGFGALAARASNAASGIQNAASRLLSPRKPNEPAPLIASPAAPKNSIASILASPPSLMGAIAKDAGGMLQSAGKWAWEAATPELLPENRYGPKAQLRQLEARAEDLEEKAKNPGSSNTFKALAERRKLLAARLKAEAGVQRSKIPL